MNPVSFPGWIGTPGMVGLKKWMIFEIFKISMIFNVVKYYPNLDDIIIMSACFYVELKSR